MFDKSRWKIILLTLGLLGATVIAEAKPLNQHKLKTFITMMVNKHQFDARRLNDLFAHMHVNHAVLTAIRSPAEDMPWFKYKKLLVTPDRVAAGVQFWQQHETIVNKAARQYQVPAEIIVAILGIETHYGTRTGRYPVLETLATLAFEYPPRANFFKAELEQFLLLAKEEQFDPKSLYGSYAGAMGQPQFISSSYRHYAVDFDQDGRRDLFNSVTDAVASTANFLKQHGWQAQGQIVVPANAKNSFPYQVPKTYKPTLTLDQWRKRYQLASQHILPITTRASHIRLRGQHNQQHWLGFQNFYVITRYNRSPLYAMAVYQLSKQIKHEKSRA